MLPPVRCFTCNKVLDWNTYDDRLARGTESVEAVLNGMGVTRYCCRRMHLCHPKELSARVAQFPTRDHVSRQFNFEMLMAMDNDRIVPTD